MALGKQVRKYRERAGWKLETLSFKSGVEVGTINALENRDSSRSKFAPQLAKAFGLTLEQLLDERIDYEVGAKQVATGESEMLAAGGRIEASNLTALPAPTSRGFGGAMIEVQAVMDGLPPLLQVAAKAVMRQWLDGQAGLTDVIATIEGMQQISAGSTPAAENRAA